MPLSLLERIRAKEREKKAREMYQDKGEEVLVNINLTNCIITSLLQVRIKRLKRLPEIARIVKGVFVSEARNALKRPFVLQKLYQVECCSMLLENMINVIIILSYILYISYLI